MFGFDFWLRIITLKKFWEAHPTHSSSFRCFSIDCLTHMVRSLTKSTPNMTRTHLMTTCLLPAKNLMVSVHVSHHWLISPHELYIYPTSQDVGPASGVYQFPQGVSVSTWWISHPPLVHHSLRLVFQCLWGLFLTPSVLSPREMSLTCDKDDILAPSNNRLIFTLQASFISLSLTPFAFI